VLKGVTGVTAVSRGVKASCSAVWLLVTSRAFPRLTRVSSLYPCGPLPSQVDHSGVVYAEVYDYRSEYLDSCRLVNDSELKPAIRRVKLQPTLEVFTQIVPSFLAKMPSG
jgi:hypothetical protein